MYGVTIQYLVLKDPLLYLNPLSEVKLSYFFFLWWQNNLKAATSCRIWISNNLLERSSVSQVRWNENLACLLSTDNSHSTSHSRKATNSAWAHSFRFYFYPYLEVSLNFFFGKFNYAFFKKSVALFTFHPTILFARLSWSAILLDS